MSGLSTLHGHSHEAGNNPSLLDRGSPSPLTFSVRSAAPQARTHPTNDDGSVSGVQIDQSRATSIKNRVNGWVEYGKRDPTARFLQARSTEDNARMDAMHGIGGACLPCRRARRRCDALDYCQRCKDRGDPSEAQFLSSIQPASYAPGLEDISLYNLQSRTLLNNRLLAEPQSSAMVIAQEQATNHVNAWFKNVTRMIDPKLFYNGLFQREVSLLITSGLNRESTTCFNLEYLDISSHLEQTAYLLDEESLLAGFVGHSSAPIPPVPSHDQLCSRRIRHLSWIISHTFAFLRSFADADLYAAINNMPAARATVSIVYASLYRYLLAKCDDLCSIVLKSLQQDFQYCTRRSLKDVTQDLLHGVAEYHCVVTELARLELGTSSEAAALLWRLKDRATSLLQHGGIERLFRRIYKMAKPAPSESMPKRLISSSSPNVPEIRSLSIALRVDSSNNDMRPVSTEAFRDTDPYQHHRPIKVRDLLKGTEDSAVDPKQIYVDYIVDNFDSLGHALPEQLGPSDNWRNYFVSQGASCSIGYASREALSTSLKGEHASICPSQQDTETRSIKSESTMQDDLDVKNTQFTDHCSRKEPVDHGWRDVPLGKASKRRERSGDSQNSRRSSGHGNRKHIKLDSGRGSPTPYKHNYFDVLTDEPTLLR